MFYTLNKSHAINFRNQAGVLSANTGGAEQKRNFTFFSRAWTRILPLCTHLLYEETQSCEKTGKKYKLRDMEQGQ